MPRSEYEHILLKLRIIEPFNALCPNIGQHKQCRSTLDITESGKEPVLAAFNSAICNNKIDLK